MSTELENVTVVLSRPVTHDGKTVASLTFREATAGDACCAETVTGDFSRTLALIASMAEISLPLAKKIPLRDINTITGKVAHLMGEPAAAVDGQTS
jgi:hypothetical protein